MGQILKFTDINKREDNEDSCLAFELFDGNQKYTILLLSDGMGGHDYGEVISNVVISNIAWLISKTILDRRIIPQLKKETNEAQLDLKDVLHQAIEVTNHKVKQLIKNNKWKDGGATLVATVIVNDNFFWGSIGDSRLYHFISSEKKLIQQGFDHNVPGILVKEGAIIPEVAKYHSQRNQLVYFIGAETLPSFEKVKFIGDGKLGANDLLILLSDGMLNKIDEIELQDEIAKIDKDNIDNIIEKISKVSKERKETDNQTCITYIHVTEENTEKIKELIIEPNLEKVDLDDKKPEKKVKEKIKNAVAGEKDEEEINNERNDHIQNDENAGSNPKGDKSFN